MARPDRPPGDAGLGSDAGLISWPALWVIVAVALAIIGAIFSASAHDRSFTPAENAWLNRQRAVDNTKCCDERDAFVGQSVEWRIVGGRYEVFYSGAWRQVPPGRIMRHNPADPSPFGAQALLFWSPNPNDPTGATLWCFAPEPLM
jgi:hypothetical protein